MPRPRKYDYQKDYPVKLVLYVNLPVEYVNELEKMGYDNNLICDKVRNYLIEIVENNRKKD